MAMIERKNGIYPSNEQLELSAQQMVIIQSYLERDQAQEDFTDDLYDTGFDFEVLPIPTHGQEQVAEAVLEKIRQAEKISPEFQGQPDLTVEELSQAALELLNCEAWKALYQDSIPATQEAKELTEELDHFYERHMDMEAKHKISLPLLDQNIRQVVTTIFTRLPKYNADSVYNILSASRAYGLFHRFCTQSFPVGMETALENNGVRKSISESILTLLLPKRMRGLNAQLEKIDSKKLSPETKWRALDKETRIELAQEMFLHVKEYLKTHPDEKVIVIEPGGGNAELSSLLAEQLYSDQDTAGRAQIIVREYSHEMIAEGREKIAQIESASGEKSLPIEFIAGTAEIPLVEHLESIKVAVQQEDELLLTRFGLSLERAKRLLAFVDGAKVIGGISTYTAGAMSQEEGVNTTTTRIFSTLASEVDQEGLIIINDFAAAPPQELSKDERFSDLNQAKIAQTRKILTSFDQAGLSAGLATVYGLWGKGVGHDTRQIWQTYLKLHQDQELSATIDAKLRPFSLFPLPLYNRYLNIPGFLEATIRCRGKAHDSQLKI